VRLVDQNSTGQPWTKSGQGDLGWARSDEPRRRRAGRMPALRCLLDAVGRLCRGAEFASMAREGKLAEPRTIIRNADCLVAWDAAAQSHVYRRGGDLEFTGNTVTAIGNVPPAAYAPISAIPQSNGTGRSSSPGAPRPAPLHHRANTAQVKDGLYLQLDERWGSGHGLSRDALRPSLRWENNRRRTERECPN